MAVKYTKTAGHHNTAVVGTERTQRIFRDGSSDFLGKLKHFWVKFLVIVNLRTCFLIEMSFYQIVLSVSVLIVTVAVDEEEELLDFDVVSIH